MQETKSVIGPKPKFSFRTSSQKSSAISISASAEPLLRQRFETSRIGSQVSPPDPLRSHSVVTDVETISRHINSIQQQCPDASQVTTRNEHSSESYFNQKSSPSHSTPYVSSDSLDLSALVDTHVILPSSTAYITSSGSVTNLRHCVVDMSAFASPYKPLMGLTFNDVEESLLICGTVSGALHVTRVQKSILLVTAGQLRMHECKDCIVYLHVGSQPIIEDCHLIRFSSLPDAYVRIPTAPIAQITAVLFGFALITAISMIKRAHFPS